MNRIVVAAGLVVALTIPALAADVQTSGLTVQNSKPFGQYLANQKGRPLYLFTADKQGESKTACSAKCQGPWPLATNTSAPKAGTGVQASMISTMGDQVTYNGHPLYYFVKDTGKTPKGEGVKAFGGNWYLVSPAGEAVMKKK